MSDIIHTEPAPTLDDVWRLIRETDRQLKEQSQEADRRFQKQAEEADRRAQEADRRFQKQVEEADRRAQEADRRFQKQAEEADRKFLEILREASKETDKKIAKLGNRLGEFVEGLIKPAVVRLFQERGIPVHKIYSDISVNNPKLSLATQIDLFVMNSEVCALIEVKSKLSIDDVNEHLERMEKFKPLFPEYADKKAYGAVAAMVTPDEVAKYAYRKGFFVIAQQGETVAILNDLNFKPLAW